MLRRFDDVDLALRSSMSQMWRDLGVVVEPSLLLKSRPVAPPLRQEVMQCVCVGARARMAQTEREGTDVSVKCALVIICHCHTLHSV